MLGRVVKFISVLAMTLTFGLTLVLTHAALANERAVFFEGLPDIPVMQGLTPQNNAIIFDKPEGRIAEIHARSQNLTKTQIQHYYNDVLVQFGWTPTTPGVFIRSNEKLTLSTETITPHSIDVVFTVMPNP